MQELLYAENLETEDAHGQNLDGISFFVNAGEVYGMTGRNGDGLGALDDVLSGRMKLKSGSIFINGKRVAEKRAERYRKLGICEIAYSNAIVPEMSAAENLAVLRPFSWRRLYTSPGRNKKIFRMMQSEYGIDFNPDIPAKKLREVEKAKITFCRAILNGGNILICYEVGNDFSDIESKEFSDFIGKIKEKGIAVIFINSNPRIILKYADRISVMRNGRIVYEREKEKLNISLMYKYLLSKWSFFSGDPSFQLRRDSIETLQLKNIKIEGTSWRPFSIRIKSGKAVGIYWNEVNFDNMLYMMFAGEVDTSAEVIHKDRSVSFHKWLRDNRKIIYYKKRGFAQNEIYENLTLRENIIIGTYDRFGHRADVLNKNMLRVALNDFAKEHAIKPEWLDLRTSKLSLDIREKIVWWRILFAQPSILAMDSPCFAVDEPMRRNFYKAIDELKKSGTAVILSGRDRKILEAACDSIITIRK